MGGVLMALPLLEQLHDAGLQIRIRNNHLALSPKTHITSCIRQSVSKEKDALLLAVKNAPAKLVELAIAAGIHEQGYKFSASDIRKLQSHDDLYDVINSTKAERQAWASALAIRATQARGMIPEGWNRTARCRQCGLVYAHYDQDILSCGWCWLRYSGIYFPQPNDG
jgi:hypothetical protein